MKILIIVMLMICSMSFANVMDIELSLDAGYFPFGHTFLWSFRSQIDHKDSLFVSADMDLRILDVIYLDTKLQVDMVKGELYMFSPVDVLSVFDIGLNWKAVSIGFKHSCIHPIITYEPLRRNGQEWAISPAATELWEGWKACVYARIQLKGGF